MTVRYRIAVGVLAVTLGVVAGSVAPRTALAQSAEARLKSNREDLARIRREREELEQRMNKLQSTAHTLTDEVQNLNQQHDVTARAVQSLNRQMSTITETIQEVTAKLINAEDEATAKRAVLRHRLIDIYKRGPTYDVEAMLSAESFGALVARYKYLHELALRDRALVRRVDQLRVVIRDRRTQLVGLKGEISSSRVEKQQEEGRLASLESRQQRNLKQVQQDARKAQARLRDLARAEVRLNNIIGDLETERRRGSARASATARGASSIKTSDYGKLSWPVDGNILYNFGRVVNPNNTVTRWNGIGIGAPEGTPVKAVAAGEVRAAEPVGSYGRTVILEHGGGDYSVYASLATISVKPGAHVVKGQVIGTVGISDPDQPPHLHFEIRHNGPAINPTDWLRNR